MTSTKQTLKIPSPSKIKTIRKKLGLSQEAFAERLGVTFSTVNRWENGHRRPTRLAIHRLDKLLTESQQPNAIAPATVGPNATASAEYRELIAIAIRNRVLLFDPADPDDCLAEHNIIDLPQELGPIRSATFDHLYSHPVLLLGARDGIILHHLDRPDSHPIRFPFGLESQRGYGANSARLSQGYLYATHSEHGLARWKIEQPTSPERLFASFLEGKSTVRSVFTLDRDRMMFVADHQLFVFGKNSEQPELLYENPAGARLTEAHLFEHTIYIASSDGLVASFDLVFRSQQALMSYEQTHLYSARVATCMSSPFLVLATRKPQVLLLGLGENPERILYTSGARNLRLAAATNDYVVAADHAQNQLYVWEADHPETPVAQIPVGQISKHHIQDLCRVRLAVKDMT